MCIQKLFSFWTLSAILVLTAACNQQNMQSSDADGDAQGVPVTAARVTKESLRETVDTIGTILAEKTVQIAPEVSGTVQTVHFDEGTRVEKGELLYTLDDTKLQRRLQARRAALKAAKARRDNAETSYKRARELYDVQSIAEAEFDRTETEFEARQADLQRLKAEVGLIQENIEDTTVEASAAGVISATLVNAGDTVKTGRTLATLFLTDRLEVTMAVPERYRPQTRRGLEFELRADAFPETDFSGKLTFVSPDVSRSTRAFEVRGIVSNAGDKLVPGMFASTTLILRTLRARTVVPEEALVATRNGYAVFVIREDNTAEAHSVQIGLRTPGTVEIREGLEAGMRIVRTGQSRVENGDKVNLRADERSNTGREEPQ